VGNEISRIFTPEIERNEFFELWTLAPHGERRKGVTLGNDTSLLFGQWRRRLAVSVRRATWRNSLEGCGVPSA